MLELIIQSESTDGSVIITFGMKDLKNAAALPAWKVMVQEFLAEYLTQHTVMVRVSTPEAYDWYSQFCLDNEIPVQVSRPDGKTVHLTIRPQNRQQTELLTKVLVEDQVWDYSDALEFCLIDPLSPTSESVLGIVAPITDGKALECKVPEHKGQSTESLVRQVSSRLGAKLVF